MLQECSWAPSAHELAAALTVALRTEEGLQLRLPTAGAKRMVVVYIWPKITLSSDSFPGWLSAMLTMLVSRQANAIVFIASGRKARMSRRAFSSVKACVHLQRMCPSLTS